MRYFSHLYKLFALYDIISDIIEGNFITMYKVNRTKWMVYNALLIALIVVLATVPWLGYIPLGIMSITIVHIPVIIGSILFGHKSGILLGIVFGVSSLLVATTRAAAGDLIFVNPLISVVPRVVFGALIGLIYSVIKKFFAERSIIAVGISALVSSLIHSFLVLTMIFIVLGIQQNWTLTQGITQLLTSFFAAAIFLEALAAAVVCVGVVKALSKTI